MGTEKKKIRRRIKVVVDPKGLLRMSIPFFVSLVVSSLAILMIHRQVLDAVVQAEESNVVPAWTLVSLHQTLARVMSTGACWQTDLCASFFGSYIRGVSLDPLFPFVGTFRA